MSRLSLTLLCSALLGLAPGCAKRSYSDASAAAPESYGGSGGGMAEAVAPAAAPADYGDSSKKKPAGEI